MDYLVEIRVWSKIETAPIEEQKKGVYQQELAVAKSLMRRHMADDYIHHIKTADNDQNIHAVLDELHKIYHTTGHVAIHMARTKMSALRYTGGDVMVHIRAFEKLERECTMAGLPKKTDQERIAELMISLQSHFEAVENSLSNTATFQEVVAKIILQYEKRQMSASDMPKVLQIGVPTCYHCNKKGHVRRECRVRRAEIERMTKRRPNPYYRDNNRHEQRQKPSQGHTYQTTVTSRAQGETPRKECNVIFNPDDGAVETSGFVCVLGAGDVFQDDNKVRFLLDSGSIEHLLKDHFLAAHFKPRPPKRIGVAKEGEYVLAKSKGELNMWTKGGRQLTIKNVLYVPELTHNILSVSKMQAAGMSVTIDGSGTTVKMGEHIIATGEFEKNTIDIQLDWRCDASVNVIRTESNDFNLWHKRLGHMSNSRFIQIQTKGLYSDSILIDKLKPKELCSDCTFGKQSTLPFKAHKDKSHITRALQVVHSDVCGKITPMTPSLKQYFLTFIDDYTHYCVVYLIRQKSDVFIYFKDFVAKAESQFGNKLETLYCDNGTEYKNSQMIEYCNEKGITFHFTTPHTPQLN